MAHLVIKNIGPIKNVELDLNKINVFMGPQSSGKSTIAKIFCHCQWVEKQCYSNFEIQSKYYSKENVFYSSLIEYHRLDGYFDAESIIIYTGEYITIKYVHQSREVTLSRTRKNSYKYPKINYIPAERNLVAAIPNLKKYNETNDVILYFMYDWFTSREDVKSNYLSSILNRDITYAYSDNTDYIIDNSSKLLLSNASSGVQSLVPLYLVLMYVLDSIYLKMRPLSYEQKKFIDDLNLKLDKIQEMTKQNPVSVGLEKLKEELNDINTLEALDLNTFKAIEAKRRLDEIFKYHFTQLYIEEPEQNLFPDTQQKLMYWLVSLLANSERDHQLVMTTHSPYILFALNNCVMGGLVKSRIPEGERNKFPSYQSWINPKLVSIYEIHEGTLKCIQDEDGIIEDNYLNKAYKETSAEYLSLLNYYEEDEE